MESHSHMSTFKTQDGPCEALVFSNLLLTGSLCLAKGNCDSSFKVGCSLCVSPSVCEVPQQVTDFLQKQSFSCFGDFPMFFNDASLDKSFLNYYLQNKSKLI